MIALDLFAGTGWGVACQRLGIEEYGVEIMPEAVATRSENGMQTIYGDVWDGLEGEATMPDYDMLIASPPCQTFSVAGSGAGRKALDDVLEAIREQAHLNPDTLRALGEKHDPRTALVLTPLAYVARDKPTYVVFEQVPPVLPVWEACAEVMRRWGYSVWTGNLQAEMYGVPQTRKRAILIARADGKDAEPPTPTHSRYYSRDPKRLDPGVLPWVSMSEALGWSTGSRSRSRVMRSNYSAGGSPGATARERGRSMRDDDKPSFVMTGKPGHWLDVHSEETGLKTMNQSARSVTIAEAAALQSYPAGFEFCGTKTKQFLQVGNAVPPLLAETILRGFLE